MVAIPLHLVLLVLRRMSRGGEAARLWEPWVLGAAALAIVASGLTGLLVRGESLTELRGDDYGIGGIHFWLRHACCRRRAARLQRQRPGLRELSR